MALPVHRIAFVFLAAMLAAPWAQADDGVFEPGLISDGGVFGLTLSPDDKTALWVRSGGRRDVLTIMESHKVNGKWQAGSVVPFSGQPGWKDIDPMFSPDGQSVIFQSNRPVPGKPERKGFDIWSVRRSGDGWGAANHLGNVINSDESESSAAMASNGNIYFMKNGLAGQSDLWISRFVDGQYQTPENLGAPINTNERESNPYIAPDESYLIYFSSDPKGLGDADLYISFREQGHWGAPQHIDAPINSPAGEFCPFVHGGRLYLSRQVKNGDRFKEDIYSYAFDPNVYRQRAAIAK